MNRTVGYSPKMVASTAVTTVVGIVIALLNGLQANSAMLGDLPPWAQFVILLAIPPLLTGFSAYKASPGEVTGTGTPSAPQDGML